MCVRWHRNRVGACAKACEGWRRKRETLKQLEADLTGYVRLRVGSYRVIVRFRVEQGERVARCVYAERRAVVYELFSEILRGEQ